MKMLNVIDLFCGCGGLSDGFRQAGFNMVGGIDINEAAVKTYNQNFHNSNGICRDISEMTDDDIVDYVNNESIDVIIGGPPCQGFSNANRYKLETDDPRNKLFFEFVKFVEILKPKFVVIENVKGIVTLNKGYALNRIYEIFESRGYCVSNKILNAGDFGVPQNRQRNFFVIYNEDYTFDFDDLKKLENVITVKETISELYNYDILTTEAFSLESKASTPYQKYLRASDNSIHNHDCRYPAQKVQDRIAHVPQGGNWADVPEHMWPTDRSNRHSSAYKRLHEERVSVTIDTGNNHSNYYHPLYNRIPTVREAARIQSFKDSFVFFGNRSEQYKQVGNAVPPLLSKAIAQEIFCILSKENCNEK